MLGTHSSTREGFNEGLFLVAVGRGSRAMYYESQGVLLANLSYLPIRIQHRDVPRHTILLYIEWKQAWIFNIVMI